MHFDEALAYLLSLGHETLTIKLGLKNTETLLAALGNPHQSFRAVQIAGTNGKGSTAVTLDSICRAAEIRTGIFTSPHLISITERIRVNGNEISETDFARLTAQVQTTAAELIQIGKLEAQPTFFEHVTAIALLFFREAKVELAILETGLGGRLDSTTTAGAALVAITPIAMDHEDYLGHTIAEIAAEKAAIIRAGVIAIVAPQMPEALEVINDRCAAAGVTPHLISPEEIEVIDNSSDGKFCVKLRTQTTQYENLRIGLRGRHQVLNAAVAIALSEALCENGYTISKPAIARGIEAATHAGRLEWWEGPPRILFDGAHNPAAARSLRDYLSEFVNVPLTIIFGAMRDKDLVEVGTILFPLANELILTELDNPRAASIEDLKASLPANLDQVRVHTAHSPDEAWNVAQRLLQSNGLICVTGSLYLIGALQKYLRDASQFVARAEVTN
jgi:dihydrofolate synthase/folylpolyglutamate synthase